MDQSILPPVSASIPAIIDHRRLTRPSAPVISKVWFDGRAPSAENISYAELFCRVERAATLLGQMNVGVGDRVLISVTDVVDFLALFLGSQCVGAIPVPAPSQGDLPKVAYDTRIDSIARNARPRVLVVDNAAPGGGLAADLQEDIRVERASALCSNVFEGKASRPAIFSTDRRLNEIAFLQYTSGSTGDPKGVVVLHSNLLANLQAIAKGSNIDLQDVSYSWLPFFHDMGLIAGVLLGIYVGIPTYVAQSRTFITRPDTWLHAITRFRATVSAGPNFAFGILARIAKRRALESIDLSSWRLAFDGSEPIDPRTARQFIDCYAPYGFRADSLKPAYGLAECTLATTFARPGATIRFDCVDRVTMLDGQLARALLAPSSRGVEYTSVGVSAPGHRVLILSPDSAHELPERHVGEVAVEGPSVTPGYFGAQTNPGILRTGDLGYLADNELFVVDRLKDLIVVGGRKYAPADVEQVVGRVLGIRPGAIAAFSAHRRELGEELFIVASRDSLHPREKNELLAEVHRAVYECFGVTPAEVFLVQAGWLPRTSSGKLRRSVCRTLLQSGALETAAIRAKEIGNAES